MKYPIFIVTLCSAVSLLQAEIPITEEGQGSPGGYVQLVASGLAANGVKIEIIGAGISGHKSNQMLQRLERDVLSKKPQWMTLSCGVNDVWHGEKGVSLEDYRKNITTIVDQAQAAGVKVMILTSTMISENQASAENQKLTGYNEFLRTLAAEKKCLLADLNADMQAAITEAAKTDPAPGKSNRLTSDGVHMAAAGNRMMAASLLKAFGINDTELTKAKDAWLDIPNTSTVVAEMTLTQRQIQQLDKLAASRNTTADGLINGEFAKLVKALLESETR